jgi:hypothetical protein
MRGSWNLGASRVRWRRVGWLLPLSLGLCAAGAAALPTLLAAAREHQVRAYFDPPPLTPPEWRRTGPEPIDVDGLLFGSSYLRGASR